MENAELIKALKEDAEWALANEWDVPITLSDELTAAADEIERLKEYEDLGDLDHLRELVETENRPLTLDEMNALDREPIYILHTGGAWKMNGWHIATASSYQNHGRCDLEIDNGNTIIDMRNYGKTWLAYRRKPERSEGECGLKQ